MNGQDALSNKLLTLRPIDATYALDLNVLEISNSTRGLAHDQQKLAPAIVTGMSLTMVLLALVPLAVLSLTRYQWPACGHL